MDQKSTPLEIATSIVHLAKTINVENYPVPRSPWGAAVALGALPVSRALIEAQARVKELERAQKYLNGLPDLADVGDDCTVELAVRVSYLEAELEMRKDENRIRRLERDLLEGVRLVNATRVAGGSKNSAVKMAHWADKARMLRSVPDQRGEGE